MSKRLLTVALAGLAIAGCAGTDKPGSGCLVVSPELLKGLDVPGPAWAVAVREPKDPNGELRNGAWFVSTADGATWFTNLDPTADTLPEGFTLPLNEQAAEASHHPPLGTEGSSKTPSYAGYTDTSVEAVASRNCAK